MASVVAGVAHVFCTRRAGLASAGNRVHTIPDALAMSIAATRVTYSGCSNSTISAWSSTNYSCLANAPQPHQPGPPEGPRRGNQKASSACSQQQVVTPHRGPAPDSLTDWMTKAARTRLRQHLTTAIFAPSRILLANSAGAVVR